jgi:predicted transcriptional regulator
MEAHAEQPAPALPETPAVTPPAADRRKLLLLRFLAEVKKQPVARGDLTRKLDTKPAEAAGLTRENASALLEECASEGLIAATRTKQTQKYELTEKGKALLEAHAAELPAKQTGGGRGVNDTDNEDVRRLRIEHLLMEVLKQPGRSLADAEIGRGLSKYAREALELNTPTARQVLEGLAAAGQLRKDGQGKLVRYELTPAGFKALANTNFPAETEFRLNGDALNALLEGARETGKEFAPEPAAAPPPEPARTESATPEQVKAFILARVGDLRSERYASSGLVPIWEVRGAVRERFGEDQATHRVFDELVLALWKEQKVTLTAISDLSRATEQQLRDAIPGSGNTLFYVEVAHELAPV